MLDGVVSPCEARKPQIRTHTSPSDNSFSNATVYTIPQGAPAGCYGWTVTAASRAFNPDGADDGLAADWWYDPRYVWVTPSLSVAIVDA